MSEYRTIKNENSDEFIVKKSRFIGSVKPVKTQQEALDFIGSIKSKHWDATHNVYAYVLREGGVRRFSDDGEPQGTAGIPCLDVLLKEDVTDCCVVVTRYFGGILLGTGGLVRAYTKGCVVALNAAQVVTMEESQRILLDIPYPMWDKINYHLQSLPQITENTEFGASVSVTLLVRVKDADAVIEKLNTLSDGKLDYLPDEILHYPWPEESQAEPE